jgi:virginiamycin B lyase
MDGKRHDSRTCQPKPSRTGKMDVKQVPTPHALPYGIVITKNNVPVFCEFGTNKIGSIDPKTMVVHEYSLPDTNTRPRRLALGPDGTIYYTDYARGYLGHFRPSRERPSPGGDASHPYGIAISSDGAVWYSES